MKSYDTRGKKQTYWKSPLEGIMTAMIHLDHELYPDGGSDADDRVRVRFADSAANDIGTMASAAQMLMGANSASIETRVEMLHPDWTKKQIAEEVDKLKDSERVAMMDKGILSRAEVRAAYMDDTPEQAKQALDEMQNEALEQQMRQAQAAAMVQAMTQPQTETQGDVGDEGNQDTTE